jgi:hypothetical protein
LYPLDRQLQALALKKIIFSFGMLFAIANPVPENYFDLARFLRAAQSSRSAAAMLY